MGIAILTGIIVAVLGYFIMVCFEVGGELGKEGKPGARNLVRIVGSLLLLLVVCAARYL